MTIENRSQMENTRKKLREKIMQYRKPFVLACDAEQRLALIWLQA